MALCTSVCAGSGEAAGKVREGLAHFKSGDFKAAAEAFSAADEALPKELRIAFDRGCAYAAQGEYDQAVEQFQKAAVATDHRLAAWAQYNLGCLSVARAKAQAHNKPEEAVGDARAAILDFLLQAARHYRDCLGSDPENADARYNLETIRLWSKHIQDMWRQRDRQKRREEMDLLQYLEWLESQQRSLQQTSKELETQKSSPQQREAVRAAENQQRELIEEIGPLKAKIAAAASGPSQQPGSPQTGQISGDAQKAVELLSRLADQTGQTMNKAADSLSGGNPGEAFKSQTEVVEMIDQIFMAVSPYANLVQRGIDRQEELINQPDKTDGTEDGWKERFISRYGRILSAKARMELEKLESVSAAKQPTQTQNQTQAPPEDFTPSGESDQSTPQQNQTGPDEQLAADQQQRDLKEALQMGVTSAPKVEKLADEAATLLEENNREEALPKQQEALKLLKDMLPKHKPQDKKDQEQKDQGKKDQNKKDQQQQPQNQQQQQDQQKKQGPQNKDQENNQEQQKQARPKRDPSKDQAEAILNRARQRREQHQEDEKQIEGYLYQPEKVDKDW